MGSFIKKEYGKEEEENECELYLGSGDLEMTEKHKIEMSTPDIQEYSSGVRKAVWVREESSSYWQ